MKLILVRTDHGLYRESGIDMVLVAADVNAFQRVQQTAAIVPWHIFGAVYHVITVQRADRDIANVGNIQFACKLMILLNHLVVSLLREIDKVHFVYANYYVRYF